MIQLFVEGQQTLKLKLNKADGERGHDLHGFAAAHIRFEETRQHLPDTLANISEWMRNQLQSDRLTEHLPDLHQLRETASLILADLNLSLPSISISSTFALFAQPVISRQPVHLSILVPCSPFSVGLALTLGVVSTLTLGCCLSKAPSLPAGASGSWSDTCQSPW